MTRRTAIRIALDNHINLAHLQKLPQAMLILQMPQLVESGQVVQGDYTFFIALLVLG